MNCFIMIVDESILHFAKCSLFDFSSRDHKNMLISIRSAIWWKDNIRNWNSMRNVVFVSSHHFSRRQIKIYRVSRGNDGPFKKGTNRQHRQKYFLNVYWLHFAVSEVWIYSKFSQFSISCRVYCALSKFCLCGLFFY